jgi:DNA-binding CsgD family transcriptional regulator
MGSNMSLHDRISAAIAGIYDSAVDRAEWRVTLRRLADLLGGTAVSLKLESADNRHVIASDGIREDARNEYQNYYRKIDPVMNFISGAPPGIYGSRRIVPGKRAYETPFYNEWGRRNDLTFCIHALAFRGTERSALLSVCRSTAKGEFGDEQEGLLNVLLPHLERALRFETRMAAENARVSLVSEALDRWTSGVIVVDERRHIRLANKAANVLLAQADGVRCENGRLCAASSTQNTALQRLIAHVIGGDVLDNGRLLLARSPDRQPLAVEVVSYTGPCGLAAGRRLALVFIVDPALGATGAERRLQDLYRLTHTEAALATAVSKGGGVKAAARALGIAPSTARTHLKSVFGKTGTARQAELATLVAASCGRVG